MKYPYKLSDYSGKKILKKVNMQNIKKKWPQLITKKKKLSNKCFWEVRIKANKKNLYANLKMEWLKDKYK